MIRTNNNRISSINDLELAVTGVGDSIRVEYLKLPSILFSLCQPVMNPGLSITCQIRVEVAKKDNM